MILKFTYIRESFKHLFLLVIVEVIKKKKKLKFFKNAFVVNFKIVYSFLGIFFTAIRSCLVYHKNNHNFQNICWKFQPYKIILIWIITYLISYLYDNTYSTTHRWEVSVKCTPWLGWLISKLISWIAPITSWEIFRRLMNKKFNLNNLSWRTCPLLWPAIQAGHDLSSIT